MFLLVETNSSKHWQLKYRNAGKEKLLVLCVHPETSPVNAREHCNDVRVQWAEH